VDYVSLSNNLNPAVFHIFHISHDIQNSCHEFRKIRSLNFLRLSILQSASQNLHLITKQEEEEEEEEEREKERERKLNRENSSWYCMRVYLFERSLIRKETSHVRKSLSWLSWISVDKKEEKKKKREKEERGTRGVDWAMRAMVRGNGQGWRCCNCGGRFSIPVEHVGRGIRQFLEKCWIESAVRVYNVTYLSRALVSVSQSFYFLSLSSAPLLSPSVRSPGYSFTFRLPFYLVLVSFISVLELAEFCRLPPPPSSNAQSRITFSDLRET